MTLNATLNNVQVLAHSAIRIEAEDGTAIYFDPFELTDAPHDADYVLVTHTHYDHLSPEDAAKVMNESTVVVCPASAEAEVREALGTAPRGMAPGDTITLGVMQIEAVPAYNVEPERLGFHPQENRWIGYVITIDGVRYYVAGDTDQNDDTVQVRCDVALVPIGGTFTMDPAQAAAFVNVIKPRIVVPTHYGSAVGTKEDVEAFEPLVDPAITVVRKLSW